MNKIFDRNRLSQHRNRFANTINDYAYLLGVSAEDIEEKLKSLEFKGGKILEVGARYGVLTRSLISNYPSSKIIVTDISEKMLRDNPISNQIIIDEENIENLKQKNFDAIVSLLNLHHLNDIKKFFISIKNLIQDGGIFVASMFGAGSLANLRRFLVECEIEAGLGHIPHIYPFAKACDIYKLLQLAGFGFIVTDTNRVEVEYDNPLACMKEIQRMGESSCMIRGAHILPRHLFSKSLSSGTFIDYVEILTLTAKV